jgi:hypothetical protein
VAAGRQVGKNFCRGASKFLDKPEESISSRGGFRTRIPAGRQNPGVRSLHSKHADRIFHSATPNIASIHALSVFGGLHAPFLLSGREESMPMADQLYDLVVIGSGRR